MTGRDTAGNAVFDLFEVSFGYRTTVPALRDLSFRIDPGEKVAVVGANGAGKTTLLKLLAGQVRPSSGMMRVFGAGVEEAAPWWSRRVALVTSNFETTLSEGQKKRVSLSAMLAFLPPVILLDEPLNALDGPGRRWFLDAVKALRASDKTLVVGTYDLVLADLAADRVLVLGGDHALLADGPASLLIKDTDLLVRAGLLHEHVHTHGGMTHRHVHPLCPRDDDHHHGHA